MSDGALMAGIRLPISQPGTHYKCCFSHVVDHGQPNACWVWVHPLLITAVPVGGSRAAIPKCCRRGALEQQKFALRVPEARMVGWPCSVQSVGEPLPACPPPSGGDWQPSGFPGLWASPQSLRVSTACVPSLCTCESGVYAHSESEDCLPRMDLSLGGWLAFLESTVGESRQEGWTGPPCSPG